MKALLRLNVIAESAVVWIGRVSAWVAILLMVVIVFDVVTRRFLVLGSTKLQELEWHIHAVLFLFCLGWAYLKNAHVRIDLVRERLNARVKLWIELLGCLVFLIPYCVIVIYYGADWWHRSFAQNEMAASATGLPYRWIIKAALPIGFFILLLSALSMAFRKILQLFGTAELIQMVDDREKAETVRLDEVKLPVDENQQGA